MRILTLDAALDGCSAGLVAGGGCTALRIGEGGRGQAAVLPDLARQVLDGTPATTLDRIAVTVGPGSFTGVRAALALAHGIGLAAGVPVVGVTTGAALLAGIVVPPGWQAWVAIRARAGHVFLGIGADWTMVALDAVPVPDRPTLVVGNAAAELAARLPPGALCPAGPHAPQPEAIARAAESEPRPALPLYLEPPRTTRPATPS